MYYLLCFILFSTSLKYYDWEIIYRIYRIKDLIADIQFLNQHYISTRKFEIVIRLCKSYIKFNFFCNLNHR